MSLSKCDSEVEVAGPPAYKNWFAKIYWYDQKKEVVPVSRIKKFAPTSCTDFLTHKWYKVKGKKEDYSDGKAHSAWALIGFIGETKEDVENREKTKRITFPNLTPPSSDPESTSTEAERLKQTYNQSVAVEQQKAKKTLLTRKTQHADSFNKFKSIHMKKSEKSSVAPDRASVSPVENSSKAPEKASVEAKENLALKRRIKELEDIVKCQNEKMAKLSTPSDVPSDWKAFFEKKFGHYDQRMEGFQQDMVELKNMFSKSSGVNKFIRIQKWVEMQQPLLF